MKQRPICIVSACSAPRLRPYMIHNVILQIDCEQVKLHRISVGTPPPPHETRADNVRALEIRSDLFFTTGLSPVCYVPEHLVSARGNSKLSCVVCARASPSYETNFKIGSRLRAASVSVTRRRVSLCDLRDQLSAFGRHPFRSLISQRLRLHSSVERVVILRAFHQGQWVVCAPLET